MVPIIIRNRKTDSNCPHLKLVFCSAVLAPIPLAALIMRPSTRLSSASHRVPPSLRAWSSLGSLVSGLLHRSIVFALASEALPHQASHQSHSSGSERMGT